MSSRYDVVQESSNPVLLHLNIEEAISVVSYFFEHKPNAISRFFNSCPSRRSNFELLVKRALGSKAIITPAATPTTVNQLDSDAAIPNSDAAADYIQCISEDRSDQPDQEEAPAPRDTDGGEIRIDTSRRAGTEGHYNTLEATLITIKAVDQGQTLPSNPSNMSRETTCSNTVVSWIVEEGRENLSYTHIEKTANKTEVGQHRPELSINSSSLLLANDPTPSISSRKQKQGANQKNPKDSTQLSNYKEETPDSDLLQHIRSKMQKIAS